MKRGFVCAALSLFLFFSAPLHAHLLTEDIVNNHFELSLPHGDRGALYFLRDKTMVVIPSYTNQSYAHNCWGRWRYDEKKQKLKLSGAKRCQVLNGNYHVHRQHSELVLREGATQIVLRFFNQK